jgi:hypothetical protein
VVLDPWTHEDPETPPKTQAELDLRASGKKRRYSGLERMEPETRPF